MHPGADFDELAEIALDGGQKLTGVKNRFG